MSTQTSGDAAEIVTTPYLRGRAIGRSQWHMGALFTWLARSEDTGGTFSLLDALSRPGSEPPAHTHTYEDEAAFVVDGDVTFRVGGKVFHATSGQFVYLPRGFEHEFTLNSQQAHMLFLITPGGIETTFDEFSEPAPALTLPDPPQGPPPDELMEAMFAKFAAAGVRIRR